MPLTSDNSLLARVNGQLAQTSDEELNNLAKKRGLAAAPTTPAGAVGIGASQDSAKMAGSRLQKAAVPTQNFAPQQTLQGAQRTEAPRAQATQGEQAASANASKLKSLSGLGDRVQGLVNEQLASVQQKASQPESVAFNTSQLGTLAPTVDQNGVKALLTQYQQQNQQAQDPTADPAAKAQAQAAVNQTLADLKNNFNIDNPDDYLDLSQGRIGTDAAAAVVNPDEVKMSTLDLTKLGFSAPDLDSLLGAGWQDLSLGQFKQRIEDVRQSEFARIPAIQAQILNLPPGSAQRQLLEKELRDLGQTGVTGVEQGMQRLQSQVNSSDQITVGGKSMSVSDALKDDNISQMVADYLNPSGDPDFKKKLEEQNSDFTTWINSHKDALTQLTQTMQKSGAGFQQIQTQQSALADVAPNVRLSDDVMKALSPDWGKAVASVTDLSQNGVYQAATQDPTIGNKLNADPTAVKALTDQGLSADQIVKASKDADAAASDPDLSAMLGLDPGAPQKFLTDPATVAKLEELAPVVSKLRAGGAQFSTMLADPGFQALVKSGEFSGPNGQATLDAFVKDPNAADHYKQYANYQNLMTQFSDIEKSGNSDQALQFLFGDDGVSADGLSSMFTELKDVVENDPFDTADKKRYDYLKGILGDDGKLDATETKSLFDRIKQGLSGSDGAPADFGNFLKGGDKGAVTFATRDDAKNTAQLDVDVKPSDAIYNTIKSALTNDGKISIDEMEKMTDSERAKLWTAPQAWRESHGVAPSFQYAQVEADKAAKAKKKQQDDADNQVAIAAGISPNAVDQVSRMTDSERSNYETVYQQLGGNRSDGELATKIAHALQRDTNRRQAEAARAAAEAAAKMAANRQQILDSLKKRAAADAAVGSESTDSSVVTHG